MTDIDPGSEPSWMERALELASRGRIGASPNPMVGAVIVDREGRLAGEGYHAVFGGPHAEIVALEAAGERARGGTLYVTLEPCAHHGKTPPCVDAILAAGVTRVVIALSDPNPVATGGADRLRAEGVDVTFSSDSGAARMLNRRWLKSVRTRRPWVTLKAGVSLDGKVATRTGVSQWITGEAARHRALELREEHDAILVGVRTVLADNPRLTRRLGLNPGLGWTRVVLDSTLRIPPDAVVVTTDPEQTLVVHTDRADGDRVDRLRATGIDLLGLPADEHGRVALEPLLDELGRRGVTALLVEGGSAVHGSFVDSGLVDEAVLFVAPVLIGGDAPSVVGGVGCDELEDATRLVFESVERVGDDLELRAVRREGDGVHGVD
jgi:diaminohydroxyphosphoribosylaminopyrimidine deaminase/5-amino-6-(5-phosphoribosylamino)uracil reductase